MNLPVSTSPCLESFFSRLMATRIIDDADLLVDMPHAMGELMRREENDVLAGLIPQAGYKCPLRIQWELTNLCNLDCVFCYNSRDRAAKYTLPADAVMDIGRQIVEMDVLEVVLSGGEVFADWKLYREIGRYLTAHDVGLHVITNGWLATDEHIRELQQWRTLSVQVSIDGSDEAAHDDLRRKQGSWRRAVRTLRAFSEAGFYTVASCAMTRTNWRSLGDYIEMCFYLGAREVLIGDLLLTGGDNETSRRDYHLDSATYEKTLLKVRRKAALYRGLLRVHMAKDAGFAVAHTLLMKPTSLIVRYDGTVIPHCLLAFPIGDVKTESLQAIWERVRGGHLKNDALLATLSALEVTGTPDLNLSRTIYTPEAEEVFL